MAKPQDKEARKAATAARRKASKERRRQLWQAFQVQRKEDKMLLPLMIGAVIVSALVFTAIGLLLASWWLFLIFGIIIGALIAFIIFGRRVQKSVYKKAEGQPGAAGWALDNLRGQWRVKQTVAGNQHLDVVHRVIGRPGVILVGEGNANRVKSLLGTEKKKIIKLVGDTPVYEVSVGNEDGQTPLKGLERYLSRLPSNIDAKRMDHLESRLAAIGSRGAAMPKGPMPQGAKMRNVQRTAKRKQNQA